MSETPETDAAEPRLGSDHGGWVRADFARKLERERNEWYHKAHVNGAFTFEARAERDEAMADRDIARLKALESDRAHDRMVGELEGVYKERDEARKKIEDWENALMRIEDICVDSFDEPCADLTEIRGIAREALEAAK